MLHCWPLAFEGHVGGMQPNLTLPWKEEANRSLASVGGRVAARVIVNLQTARDNVEIKCPATLENDLAL